LIQDDEEKASPDYTQDDSEEDAPNQNVDIQLRRFNEEAQRAARMSQQFESFAQEPYFNYDRVVEDNNA
jgi:hypothetical protein